MRDRKKALGLKNQYSNMPVAVNLSLQLPIAVFRTSIPIGGVNKKCAFNIYVGQKKEGISIYLVASLHIGAKQNFNIAIWISSTVFSFWIYWKRKKKVSWRWRWREGERAGKANQSEHRKRDKCNKNSFSHFYSDLVLACSTQNRLSIIIFRYDVSLWQNNLPKCHSIQQCIFGWNLNCFFFWQLHWGRNGANVADMLFFSSFSPKIHWP